MENKQVVVTAQLGDGAPWSGLSSEGVAALREYCGNDWRVVDVVFEGSPLVRQMFYKDYVRIYGREGILGTN